MLSPYYYYSALEDRRMKAVVGPVTKKVPNTLSISIDKWRTDQVEQFSPLYQIDGIPWRLRVYLRPEGYRSLALVCDMASVAELWEVTATIRYGSLFSPEVSRHTFNSWDPVSHQHCVVDSGEYLENHVLKVDMAAYFPQSWRIRPSPNLFDCRDGILVIGDNKIYVNKMDLASQSPYFEKLFFGGFMEQSMKEIPIGGVEFEDFCNLIKIVYRSEGARLSDATVDKVLQLADQFYLKIVEDRVVSYLLSSSSSISTVNKLLIAEQYNIPFLKEQLLSRSYTNAELKELSKSDELRSLCVDTILLLFQKATDQLA